MTLHDGGFRPRIEVSKPSSGTGRIRSLLLLNVIAVVVGVVGLFTSLYLLAARLFDNVPYSALEIMLPVGIGTIACLVLQGIAMSRVMK